MKIFKLCNETGGSRGGSSLVKGIHRRPDAARHNLHNNTQIIRHDVEHSERSHALRRNQQLVPELGAMVIAATSLGWVPTSQFALMPYLSKHCSIVGCRPCPEQADAERKHSIDTQQVIQAPRNTSGISGATWQIRYNCYAHPSHIEILPDLLELFPPSHPKGGQVNGWPREIIKRTASCRQQASQARSH